MEHLPSLNGIDQEQQRPHDMNVIVGKIRHILENALGVARHAEQRLQKERSEGRGPFLHDRQPETVLDLTRVIGGLTAVRQAMEPLLRLNDAHERRLQLQIIDTVRESVLETFHEIEHEERADTSGDYRRGFSIMLDVALDRIDDLHMLVASGSIANADIKKETALQTASSSRRLELRD